MHGLSTVHFPEHADTSASFILSVFQTKPIKVQKESQECGNDDHVMILSSWLPCTRKKKMHPVTGGDRVAGVLASHS